MSPFCSFVHPLQKWRSGRNKVRGDVLQLCAGGKESVNFRGISCAGIVVYLVSSPRFRGMTAEDAKRFMKGIMHAGERYEQL